MTAALQLGRDKGVLRAFYAGYRMESPNGGFFMALGIRPGAGGDAVALLECSASSLRYEVVIPKATRAERKTVRDAIDDGREPECPRHGFGYHLVRAGPNLICRGCGVAYARI